MVAATDRRGPTRSPPGSGSDPWRRELAEVYRSHADFVRRSAGHLGTPRHAIDDVVHDVFIIAHRRLPDFDQARGSVRAWLFGITKRVALHHRRSAARHQRRLRVVTPPRDPPHPDEALARQRVVQHIEAFLDQLPPAKRTVFALADIEGMPAVEVARSLGINVNTVYARLRSARQAFAQCLDALNARTPEEVDDGRS